ncbi:vacuolar protein sorting-associated protein 33B isoform X4 [Herpailurus yagouaroundi]|uniref:vacuolar protein sorting-associated protein 33B isoform X4 n=1 Tax=Herpailurus yagouaroundi TaxID=1608482 RepID=UPI001AD67972|nr:vacuolar protein sorting-associated protein 33B isoform X4 [Puma yagouaroundi]
MAFPHRLDAPELPDFSMLKRLARDQLIYLLEQLPGKKDLFIEADLMSPLDRIANVSILKQHEVDKLYKVENKPAISSSEQLCFLVRPRIKNMRYVASLVNADKLAGRTRKYKVIFSPQKFHACEMVLEEEGVYGDVSCDEWAFSLLPLDVDLLSMELPEFFRDYFLEGDQRWINTVAQALHLLSTLYGPFPNCYGIGRCAKMSYELWRTLEEEEDGETKGRRPEIGHIFLLDRDVDFVTALCSQVVYEGLVDDTFRIKCGSVDFGPEVTSSDRSLKVLLNAEDKVFNEIRNEHFSNVFGFLSQKARNLQAQYDRRRGMDIKQMKNFVSQELKGLKQEHRLLSVHIGACESIMKKKTKQDFQELIKTEHALLEGFNIRESTSYIEEHIDRQVSPIESLRLMCLLSITENAGSIVGTRCHVSFRCAAPCAGRWAPHKGSYRLSPYSAVTVPLTIPRAVPFFPVTYSSAARGTFHSLHPLRQLVCTAEAVQVGTSLQGCFPPRGVVGLFYISFDYQSRKPILPTSLEESMAGCTFGLHLNICPIPR